MRYWLTFTILFLLAPACFAQSPWPGQTGNAVGYAGWGAIGTTPCSATFTSGTAGNPTIYQNCVYSSGLTLTGKSYIWFLDCDFLGGGDLTSNSNIVFAGSRFQDQSVGSWNLRIDGGNSNIYFLYDSFTPLVSLVSAPPGSLWPSAGAGSNSTTITDGTNATPYADSYQYGVLFLNGPDDHFYFDHCDWWGFGNALDTDNLGTGPLWLTSSWMHDASGNNSDTYHTDGIGYLNGTSAPSNVTVIGNTLTTLGNTYDIAWEAGTSGYDKLINYENYVTGEEFTIAGCDPGTQFCTHSAFTGNVIGTDIPMTTGALYGVNLGTGSVWNCNRIAFRAGTTWTAGGWTPTSGMDGQYWITSSAVNSSTDQGGNTVCATTTPAAIDFMQQKKNTTSASQTITLKNTGSSTLTITSIALQTGTNFSIASNTCGSSLSTGVTCTVALSFSPTALSPYTDELLITDNMSAASSPQIVPLLGLGTSTGGTTGATPAPATAMFAVKHSRMVEQAKLP